MVRKLRIGTIAILALASAIGSGASAQTETGKASDRLVGDLAACLAITADTDRLACTDIAARRLVDAVQRRDIVVLERGQITRTQRSLFGLQVDAGVLLASREAPAERIESLDTRIVSAARVANDRWALTLAEGGRWQTTETWGGGTDPQADMAVTIGRGALGSYVLRSKGMRSVKVRRIP